MGKEKLVTLLSNQEVKVADIKVNKQKVTMEQCKFIIANLIEKRTKYEKYWEEISKYQIPYLIADDTKEKDKGEKILNNVAWNSNLIQASGILSGVTPPSRDWFKYTYSDKELNENTSANEVLEERKGIMLDVLAKSNFYNVLHSAFSELPFGQGAIGIFYDSKQGINCVNYQTKTYYIDCNADRIVNTFARNIEFTVNELAEQFGLDNLPLEIQNEYKDKGRYNKKYKVWWLITPNDDYVEGKFSLNNYPYHSLYWLDGKNNSNFLYQGGTYEFPIAVVRYLVKGADVYGIGNGLLCLGDSKELQLLEYDVSEAVEMGVHPPLKTTAGVVEQGINLIAGGINIVNDINETIEPLFRVQIDLNAIFNQIRTKEEAIKNAYNTNLFLMLSQIDRGGMTAREVNERSQEKMQQLGSFIQRMQHEFINPILERIYNILERYEVFPPISDELVEALNEQEINIEHISPMAQAQKLGVITEIEQTASFITQMAQIDPNAIKKLDINKAIDLYAQNLHAPLSIIRSDNVVGEMIQAEQEVLEEHQQQQQMMSMLDRAEPLSRATKNITEAVGQGQDVGLENLAGLGVAPNE